MISDTKYAGALPAIYDRYVRPMKFEPYAEDLARRVAALRPDRILETAAGTGVVTEYLLTLIPRAEVMATDLSPEMLEIAARKLSDPRVQFQQADALKLPFADNRFDVAVTQFGVMFFPDRVKAYREARRVIRKGGSYLFNSWSSAADNPITEIVMSAVSAMFPDDPPSFFSSVPFSYHSRPIIADELNFAGFEQIEMEMVIKESVAPSAHEAALALCQGTPLRLEIESRAPGRLEEVTSVAAASLERELGTGKIKAPMAALVIHAM